MDFGIYQLAATFDRTESQDNLFITLASFGRHIYHHMFPTLDHAILHQFHDILHDTCKEFEAELSQYPFYELLMGQFRQLTVTKPKKC